MDFQSAGRILLVIGIGIAIAGGLLMLLASTGILDRLGALPGTLRIEGSGFTCLVPILGSILLSVILTIVLNIILRIVNRP